MSHRLTALTAALGGQLIGEDRCVERLAPFFERPAEELEHDARGALERIHPEDRERAIQRFEYSRAHLTPWDDEFRLLLPERGVIWVEGHSVPVQEPDGATT